MLVQVDNNNYSTRSTIKPNKLAYDAACLVLHVVYYLAHFQLAHAVMVNKLMISLEYDELILAKDGREQTVNVNGLVCY